MCVRERTCADGFRFHCVCKSDEGAGNDGAVSSGTPLPPKPKLRYDSTGYRETIFDMGSGLKNPSKGLGELMGAGMSEAELFLTKGGASQETLMENDVDEGLVRRYALIGLGSTIAAGGLSFWRYQPKPKFSADVYLQQVLIAQSTLPTLAEAAEQGDWDGLTYGLNRLAGSNGGYDLRGNLLAAAATLDSVDDVDRAKAVAFDVLGFVDNADYRTYFDTQGRVPAGAKAVEAAAFCSQGLRAANREVARFMRLMPASAVASASAVVEEDYGTELAAAREQAVAQQKKLDAGRVINDGVRVRRGDNAKRTEDEDLVSATNQAIAELKIENPAPYDQSILEESWRLSEEADEE